jgi:hypothetical protein
VDSIIRADGAEKGEIGGAVALVLVVETGRRPAFIGIGTRVAATSCFEVSSRVYPYLLRGVAITRANQVWAMDITCIAMARGFVVLDWSAAGCCRGGCRSRWKQHSVSRRWRTPWGATVSRKYSTPTSARSSLAKPSPAHGKGAWRDNVFVERLWRSVKYEEVYLRAYDSVSESVSALRGVCLRFRDSGTASRGCRRALDRMIKLCRLQRRAPVQNFAFSVTMAVKNAASAEALRHPVASARERRRALGNARACRRSTDCDRSDRSGAQGCRRWIAEPFEISLHFTYTDESKSEAGKMPRGFANHFSYFDLGSNSGGPFPFP